MSNLSLAKALLVGKEDTGTKAVAVTMTWALIFGIVSVSLWVSGAIWCDLLWAARVLRRGVLGGLLKLILITCLAMAAGAWAQQTAPGPRDAAEEPETATSSTQRDSDDSSLTIGIIVSEYGRLRLLAYVALVISVAVGLVVYVMRRRPKLTFAITAGVLAAVVAAVISFGLFSTVFVSAETATCAEAKLQSGRMAQRYDDACRDAREGAANAFGLVSLFRGTVMSTGPDTNLPMAGGVVKAISWISLLAACVILYYLLRPLALKLAVRI